MIVNPLIAKARFTAAWRPASPRRSTKRSSTTRTAIRSPPTSLAYAFPSAAELPSFELVSMETPTPVNPLGVKGIGESGTIGATPAVQNAVVDALAPFGVRHVDMPCSAENVWRALQEANA